MRKRLVIFLAFALISIFGAVACGQEIQVEQPQEDKEEDTMVVEDQPQQEQPQQEQPQQEQPQQEQPQQEQPQQQDQPQQQEQPQQKQEGVGVEAK